MDHAGLGERVAVGGARAPVSPAERLGSGRAHRGARVVQLRGLGVCSGTQ